MVLAFAIGVMMSNSARGELGYFCTGNNSFYNFTVDATVYDIAVPCMYGCDTATGKCRDDVTEQNNLPIIIGLTAMIGLFFLLAIIGSFDQNWWFMRIFFIMLGMWVGIADIWVILRTAEITVQTSIVPALQSLYGMWILLTQFLSFLFVIIIFWKYSEQIIGFIKFLFKRHKYE